MLLILLAGGSLVAGFLVLLFYRRRPRKVKLLHPGAFLWVDLWFKATPFDPAWQSMHVLLPWGLPDKDIDSTALTLAAVKLHHAKQPVVELRVQYLGPRRCSRPYVGKP